MSTRRKIIHVDMDAFFASVEQRDRPELKARPIAVGGSNRRGVVASASYEARRYGVRSAMPSVTAKRLCPDLIFVKARFEVYREVSQQIRRIFYDYTDLVEPLSLDEAYLDVTENKRGLRSAMFIAERIREAINERTQLTASAGVSFNKFLAKIASDINKPDGMKAILPGEALDFLAELPIERFHGIGKVTARKMKQLGIHRGADLRAWTEIDLVRRFGKVGRYYYRIVRADDERPVNPNRIRKSIGAERTFTEDLNALAAMQERLTDIAGKVFDYCQKHQNFGRTVTLKVKTTAFKTHTRSRTFQREVRRREDLLQIAAQLLQEQVAELDQPIRLLGVSVSNLMLEHPGEGIQLELELE